MKIKVNGEKIIELDDCCHWGVRNHMLYNINTQQFEGVDGDEVTYYRDNYHTGKIDRFDDIVEGYTCFQIINGKKYGNVVLSANDQREGQLTVDYLIFFTIFMVTF